MNILIWLVSSASDTGTANYDKDFKKVSSFRGTIKKVDLGFFSKNR
jgi:hypothetical protein